VTVTSSTLRTAFTEFADTSKYPDATVAWWIARAYRMLRLEVWGDDLDDGVTLYIAHNLVLSAKNVSGAASGNLGGVSGPISSKSVGGVSASFDTHAVTIEGAADYNLTTYGVQFYRMMMMYGAGGLQLSGSGEHPESPEV
jgi:hypothetical protein